MGANACQTGRRRRERDRRRHRRADRFFIQTGIVGVGLSGFYVQFFYGLIIILSLVGHRWNQITTVRTGLPELPA